MSEPSPEQVSTQEADPALLRRALEAAPGDFDSAYEVLGKQYSISSWVSVLKHISQDPNSVDLELVAHRTLRRPPEVVVALLELAAHAGTPQAGFLARVTSAMRSEETVRERAASLNHELVARHDIEELLAAENPLGALYAVLARSLAEQAREVDHLAALGERETLIDAIRIEYERLQEVARDTRWRSGSYRHALRHALADLALVARARGLLEDRAYRLLQQRTDAPESKRELLSLVDPELRSRYLNWVLERSSAESSPERALFAIEGLAHYPGEVERPALRGLLLSKSTQVAAAAASYLLTSDPSDGSSDQQIAELLASDRDALLETIISAAPDRLRLDLWPPDADAAIAERSRGNRDIAERVAKILRASPDREVRMRGLRLLGQIGRSDLEFHDLAYDVVADVFAHGPTDPELDVVLDSEWLRPAVWASIGDLPISARVHILDGLLVREHPTVVAEKLAAAHAKAEPQVKTELEEYVLDAVASESLAAQAVVDLQDQLLIDSLAPAASARVKDVRRELERLRPLVGLGEEAAVAELHDLVAPLIDRAKERSTGNERLARDYDQLGSALRRSEDDPEDAPPAQGVDPAELAALTKTLADSGVDVCPRGSGFEVSISDDLGLPAVVRAAALVDHRLSRAHSASARATAQAVLSALADRLGETGRAETILRDLFDRGSTFQAALTLSPDARTELLDAATRAGFDPPAQWREHPALGEWLAGASPQPTSEDGLTGAGAQAILKLQQIERERRALETQLDAGRSDARRAFLAAAGTTLDDLEQTADAYVQLWLGLARVGIEMVAALGQTLRRDELDSERYEIVGDQRGERYVVRSSGVVVRGEVLRRARVEALD